MPPRADAAPQEPQAPDPLVARYLDYVWVEKRLAQRTVELYTADLQKLQANARKADVALTQVKHTHLRRWVAQMHSSGRSGRGIALILSGWRGFYTWLGREGLVPGNPVQDVRSPKSPKPLPKALSVDEAVQLASFTADATQKGPFLEARDQCINELLYGCGLRIGELVGLDVQASGKARGWIDMDGGDAHVLGKGEKRRSVPVGGAALKALQQWLAVRSLCARPGAPGGEALSSTSAAPGSRRSTSACGSSSARNKPDLPRRCIRTCCATRLPAMCCSPAATCARCRSCWATPTSPPRRSTRGSIFSTWPRFTMRRIRGRYRTARARKPSRSRLLCSLKSRIRAHGPVFLPAARDAQPRQ